MTAVLRHHWIVPGLATQDLSWHEQAACLDADYDTFFPPGEPSAPASSYDEARRICRECPVFDQCAEYIKAVPSDFGFWAGTMPQDRKPGRIAKHARRPGPSTRRRAADDNG